MSFPFYTPKNNAGTVLTADHVIGDGILQVDDLDVFGTTITNPVKLTSIYGGQIVIFTVTSNSGGHLTIGSFLEGTSDIGLPAGTVVEMDLTAGDVVDLQNAINSLGTVQVITANTASPGLTISQAGAGPWTQLETSTGSSKLKWYYDSTASPNEWVGQTFGSTPSNIRLKPSAGEVFLSTRLHIQQSSNTAEGILLDYTGTGRAAMTVNGGNLEVGGGSHCISTSGTMHVFGLGGAGQTDTEEVRVQWDATNSRYQVVTAASGAGVVRDLKVGGAVFKAGGATTIQLADTSQAPLTVKAAATKTGTISNVALTSNVATITTSIAHGFLTGETVVVSGLTNTFFNGGYTIVAVPTTTTFTYALTHANFTSAGDSGSAVVSQTANLQEWKNGAGTTVATINASGYFGVGTNPIFPFHVAANNASAAIGIFQTNAIGYGVFISPGSDGNYALNISNAANTVNRHAFYGSGDAYLAVGSGKIGINKNSSLGGTLHIVTSSLGTIGQVVQATTGQTANLTEWQNSSGGLLSYVKSSGVIHTDAGFEAGGNTPSAFGGTINGGVAGIFYSWSVSISPIVARGFVGQTANLQEWQNSSGAVLAAATSTGDFTMPRLGVNTTSLVPGVFLRIGASDNSVVWSVNNASGSLDAKNWDCHVDTNYMEFRTANDAYNHGTPWFRCTRSGESIASITFPAGRVEVQTTSNSDVPLAVRGGGAQSANLQEWRNNGGTPLTKVAADGTLTVNGASTLATLLVADRSANRVGIGITSPAATLDVVGQSGNQAAKFSNISTTNFIQVTNSGETENLFLGVSPSGAFLQVSASATLRIETNGGGLGPIAAFTASIGTTGIPANVHLYVENTSAADTNLVLRAAPSQSANLTEWQNSTGGKLVQIKSDGSFDVDSQYSLSINTTPTLKMVNAVSLADSVATVFTEVGNGTSFNNHIITGYNGAVLNRHIISASSIQLSGNAYNVYPAPVGQVEVLSTDTARIALLVKGKTSQTASLIECRDASGTPITSVSASGVVKANGVATAYATKSANYTVTSSDSVIVGDASAGVFTLTLPAANSVFAGREFRFKKVDGVVSNAITISRAGSDTIDGATSIALNIQYQSVTLVSDGSSNWWVF